MKTRQRHRRSDPSGQDIQGKAMSLLPVCIVLLSYALMKGCAGEIQCLTCDDCELHMNMDSCPSDEVTEAIALTTTTRLEELFTTSVPESTAGVDVTEAVTKAEEVGEGDEAEPGPVAAEPAEAEAVEGEKVELQSTSLALLPDIMSNLNVTRRKRGSASNPFAYYCYSVEIDAGGRIRTKKGCIKVPENNDACSILKEKYEALDKSCMICSQDNCNSAFVLKYSLAAALLVVVNCLFQW